MNTSSKQGFLLFILLVTGIWFLAGRVFHMVKIVLDGFFWGIQEVWEWGSPTPLSKPHKKKKTKKNDDFQDIVT